MNYSVAITITGKVNSKKLFSELVEYEAGVSSMLNETYVYCGAGIKLPDALKIIDICSKYGNCNIELHMIPMI